MKIAQLHLITVNKGIHVLNWNLQTIHFLKKLDIPCFIKQAWSGRLRSSRDFMKSKFYFLKLMLKSPETESETFNNSQFLSHKVSSGSQLHSPFSICFIFGSTLRSCMHGFPHCPVSFRHLISHTRSGFLCSIQQVKTRSNLIDILQAKVQSIKFQILQLSTNS